MFNGYALLTTIYKQEYCPTPTLFYENSKL